MNIHPEFKKIAMMNAKIERLAKSLEEKLDMDGLDVRAAYLIHGCKVIDGELYQNGERLTNVGGCVDNDYFAHQLPGYFGDDFYGTVYYRTDVPGEYVAVPFAM